MPRAGGGGSWRAQLTAWEVARQMGRQWSRVVTAAADAVMAAAAVAVAIPVALSATSRLPGGTRPPRPRLSYTIAVNGHAQEYSGLGPLPRYVISPGEELSVTVDVTVPEGTTVTVLWLGITDGWLSAGGEEPVNMSPVLAGSRDTTLSAGAHRFSFRWAVPTELGPGASRQLTVQWGWLGLRSPGTGQRIIAALEVLSRFAADDRPGAALGVVSGGDGRVRLSCLTR
jgi:hypothetical protein